MMSELTNLRTESAKTFDLGMGKRRLEAYLGAIHYKDNYANKAETWKDIDLTWEGDKITKAPYELTREGQKFTLKDKKTGEVSTIELLSTTPAGIAYEIIPEPSAVKFRHVLSSDKIPFEAKFKITGKIPFRTNAADDEGELSLETILMDGILTEKISSIEDKELGQVRPAKGSIRIDPSWLVGASSDDAYRRLAPSAFSLTSLINIAGGATATNYQYGCGMRFIDISIPQGATIETADITFTRYGGNNGDVCNTRISAEDVDNAPTFANDAAAFDARWAARTTARVDWDAIPSWLIPGGGTSPDISSVIQEIVSRVGWQTNNDIVIFWDDFDDRSSHANDANRRAYSYDNDTSKVPRLDITYVAFIPKIFFV